MGIQLHGRGLTLLVGGSFLFPDIEKTTNQPRPSPSNLTRTHFVIELEENLHEVLFIPSSFLCTTIHMCCYRNTDCAVLDGFGIALLHSDYVPCCPSKFRKNSQAYLPSIFHTLFTHQPWPEFFWLFASVGSTCR